MREYVYRPFKRLRGLPDPFLCHPDEILTYFHSHVLWVLLFPALVFQAGKPGVGLGSLTVQSQDISLNS